jgi:hypothetical protein
MMPVLTWIAIGVGGSFVLATTVALGVASILGLIARDVSAPLYDGDDWAEMPVSREAERQTKAGSARGVAA